MKYAFAISGFINPSSGTAIVNGYDIKKDIAKVRKSLGLCPQHNVLFDWLTAGENLELFSKVSNIIFWFRLSVFLSVCLLG